MNALPPAVDDIAEARRLLAAIGHPWMPDVPDPGARLARVPRLLADLRQWAASRREGREPDPSLLRRPLPHGLDVAALIEEGGLQPGSAFLFGAMLLAEPAAGAAALRRWINHGSYHRTADGAHEHRRPQLAARFPRCPVCGLRQLHEDGPCSHGIDPARIDPRWVALIDAIDAD